MKTILGFAQKLRDWFLLAPGWAQVTAVVVLLAAGALCLVLTLIMAAF